MSICPLTLSSVPRHRAAAHSLPSPGFPALLLPPAAIPSRVFWPHQPGPAPVAFWHKLRATFWFAPAEDPAWTRWAKNRIHRTPKLRLLNDESNPTLFLSP